MTFSPADLEPGLPDEELPLPAGGWRAWGDEETALLAQLWTAGDLSASQIALRMPGRTRNSIIGRAHALGLQQPKREKRKRVPQSVANAHLRKAFVSKGDDASLTRFVKVATGPVAPKPRQPRMQGFDNPTIEAGRSIFYRHGVQAPRH